MSLAEIQDNKWEAEAAKVQIMTPGGIGMLVMMGAFTLFFGWVMVFSVMGSFTEAKTMDFDKKQKSEAASE
ncbi:MAG: hypothetical protein R6X02_30130 [Enhygromyxa sp.]